MTLDHPAFVQRSTYLRAGGEAATLSLIPSALDLDAFDEFARPGRSLWRWASNPRLMVLRNVIDYSSTALPFYTEFTALGPLGVDASSVNCIAAGIEGQIGAMSGGVLRFASVEIVSVAPGSRFRTDRLPAGVIVVLPALSLGASGRGTYYHADNGRGIGSGAIFISVQGLPVCSASLSRLYAHELGHALGYSHVTRQLSIMSGLVATAPLTAFDRDANRTFYQRPSLNRSPDIDPSWSSVNTTDPLRVPLREPER